MDEHNRFNVIYHNISEEDQVLVRDIKGAAAILASLIKPIKNKEAEWAMYNLETCIMWALRGFFVGHESS